MAKDSKPLSFIELYKAFDKDFPAAKNIEFVPSGSIILDDLMGGGTPLGRCVEFYSEPGVGKTLIAKCMHEALLSMTDYFSLHLDPEHSMTANLLKGPMEENRGKRFAIHGPQTFEEVENVILKYSEAEPKLRLVVIDSITAVAPKQLMEESIGGMRPGLKAQMESLFAQKFKQIADTRKFCIVYINQTRTKFNFMNPRLTGKDSAGGQALKFYMDVRFKLSTVKKIQDAAGNIVGAQVEVKSMKNRLAGNYKSEIYLKYGVGVSNVAAYIHHLIRAGLVTQSGSSFIVDIPKLNIKENVRGMKGLEALINEKIAVVVPYMKEEGLTRTAMTDKDLEEAAEEAEV